MSAGWVHPKTLTHAICNRLLGSRGKHSSIGQSRNGVVEKSCVAVIRREEVICREGENKWIYAWPENDYLL